MSFTTNWTSGTDFFTNGNDARYHARISSASSFPFTGKYHKTSRFIIQTLDEICFEILYNWKKGRKLKAIWEDYAGYIFLKDDKMKVLGALNKLENHRNMLIPEYQMLGQIIIHFQIDAINS